MAGNAYLSVLTSGVRSMVRANQTSAGAGDAGKVVALNSTGLIDPTMLCGAGAWPLLDVSGGTSTGVTSIQSVGSSFTKLTFGHAGGNDTVSTDTSNGWSASNSLYTIPVTGTYLISSKLRWLDNSAVSTSYGQGVGASAIDAPYFQWFVTPSFSGGSQRNGSLNVRIARFTAGQTIQMYAYVDATTLGIASASLNVALMAVG